MTEDEKYEIAVLSDNVAEKRMFFEQQAMMNTPTDLAEQQKAMIAFSLAQTEYLEAIAELHRAQLRIANTVRP